MVISLNIKAINNSEALHIGEAPIYEISLHYRASQYAVVVNLVLDKQEQRGKWRKAPRRIYDVNNKI